MEQRPLRLGDIVDDYCPRERRVTNHAVVAIVEDAIRQTRCTTCDAEHVYKGGQAPRKRAKDPKSALYDQVLADVAGPGQLVAPRATSPQDAPVEEADAVEEPVAQAADAPGDADPMPEPPPAPDEAWSTHRRLIRATLPRTEGETPTPRPIPEFTMHQRSHGRNGWNGNAPGRNGHGFAQGRPGPHGGGRPGRHRNKHKRSR